MSTDVVRYYQDSDNELSRRYLREQFPELTPEYFTAALQHRYQLYPEIPALADFDAHAGRDVLEIGTGHGLDHLMFARSGARLSGVDLTMKHCRMTALCLESFGLRSRLCRADAQALPFADASFDHVYSCGVLLVPDIEAALEQIHRVLRPGGSTLVMLYNRSSLHYWVKTRGYYGWALAEDKVLGRDTVDDWYTDGSGYVRTWYYGPRDLKRLFRRFARVEYCTTCLTPEQLPEVGLPADPRHRSWRERRFGFFLWVKAWR